RPPVQRCGLDRCRYGRLAILRRGASSPRRAIAPEGGSGHPVATRGKSSHLPRFGHLTGPVATGWTPADGIARRLPVEGGEVGKLALRLFQVSQRAHHFLDLVMDQLLLQVLTGG